LIVSTMIVTGVLIWWRKRKLRNPKPRVRDNRSAVPASQKALAKEQS
jgi:hypothetical protein